MQVELTPEQEAIVQRTLALGRYPDSSAVVEAALDWIERCNEAFVTFNKTLEDAVAESERDGYVSLDEVLADMDRIIEAAETRQREPQEA